MATVAINLAIGFAASYLSNLIAPSPGINQEGPRLSDLSAPKSSYGAGIPRCYGSVRVAGNLIWSRNIRETVTTQEVRSGGKGGGGGGTSTTYSYNGTFAVLLCEGPIIGVKRVWLNSKLVYNIDDNADLNTYLKSIEFENKMRIYTGSSSQTQDSLIAATEGDSTPAYRGRSYIVFDDIPLEEWGNRLPAVSCEVVKDGYFYSRTENQPITFGNLVIGTPINRKVLVSLETTVGAIAEDICARLGINSTLIDTTEVNDIGVWGYWTNNNISGRDALAQLQKVFFFDVIESGGKLKFIRQIRTTSPVSIPLSDLAAHEYGQNRGDDFNVVRTQDTEIIEEVTVTYLDLAFAYQQSSQAAKRQISVNKNKNDLKFDIVLDASTALAVARKTLYLAWAQRRTFTFTLPIKYCILEPGDIISIPFFGNNSLTLYILEINIGANLLLEFKCVPYEPSILALSAVATAPSISLSIPTPSNTNLTLLDINLIKDTDTEFGIYVAASGNSAWRNANLFISRNNGNSYEYTKQLLTKTIIGTCVNTLGVASEFTRDLGNSINVIVESGQLESISEIDFMNGRNCVLIGDEIIYFKNATLTASNQYTLTELLRGRRGTEWAISSHVSDERFIFLGGYLERIEGQILDLNSQRLYKAPISNQGLPDVTAVPFTSTGRSLKPYAPCHIKGVRDSGNNLSITWVRRTRKGGLLVDYKDVDLAELSEAYEIDILSGTTVVRTISTTTTSINYSAANQILDFGAVQASVNVKIYQVSGYVGRGYAGVGVI